MHFSCALSSQHTLGWFIQATYYPGALESRTPTKFTAFFLAPKKKADQIQTYNDEAPGGNVLAPEKARQVDGNQKGGSKLAHVANYRCTCSEGQALAFNNLTKPTALRG
eukprot:1382393-Amphidinium_carterae.1